MKKLLIPTLFAMLFLWLSGPANAQTDTLKHTLSIGLNFQTHGEVCGGGLPRASQSSENRSSFISGRTRIVADYRQNDWLQSHLVVQNSAIWGSKGNLAVNLYEGWVKATARWGWFSLVVSPTLLSRKWNQTKCRERGTISDDGDVPVFRTSQAKTGCFDGDVLKNGTSPSFLAFFDGDVPIFGTSPSLIQSLSKSSGEADAGTEREVHERWSTWISRHCFGGKALFLNREVQE